MSKKEVGLDWFPVNPKKNFGKEVLWISEKISSTKINTKLILKSAIVALCLGATSQFTFAISVTDTLPQNVRAFGWVFIGTTGIEEMFNSRSERESLSKPLTRDLRIGDLENKDPRLKALRSALNSYGPYNFGDDLIDVSLTGDVQIHETRKVAAFLYGVTDRLTLGAFLPYIERDTEASFSVSSIKRTQQLRNALGQMPGALESAILELEGTSLDTAFFSKELFEKNGYKTPSNFQKTGFGDLELEARYRFYRSPRFDSAFRFTARFPTHTGEVELSNLLDRPLGQNNVSLRLGAYGDYRILPGLLSWNSSVSVMGHFNSKETRAIKLDPAQDLPNLNDPRQVELLTKSTGPDLKIESGFMVDFWKGIVNLSSTYVWEYHGKDAFQGRSSLDYGALSGGTEAETHAVDLALEFSTIPAYLDNNFPVPAKFVLSWYQPFYGRNVPLASYGRIDFVLLF
jgi:hypothetical protein